MNLIISPQQWGKVFISKHHYAEELLKRGEAVTFVNPPRITNDIVSKVSISYQQHKSFTIGVIDYTVPYFIWRCHGRLGYVYEKYMELVVLKKIMKLCPVINEAWYFNSDFIYNLKKLKASKHILFYADMMHWKHWKTQVQQADIFVSISQFIFNKYASFCKKQLLLNHGLAEEFCSEPVQSAGVKNEAIVNVGYVGNMLIGEVLHMDCIEQLVSSFPQVHFHFFGPFEANNNNLGNSPSERIQRFINVLRSASNVSLHGPKAKRELVNMMQEMDMFIIAYSRSKDHNDNSNSHKILEYLSTGKTVVSFPISYYNDHPGLIEFVPGETVEDYIAKFNAVISDLDQYNSPAKQQTRKSFALDHTYNRNVDKIRSVLYN